MESTNLSESIEYRKLVEQLPAISYVVKLGAVNRTIYISPQLEAILGFTPAEWQADPHLWINQLCDEDRARITKEVYKKNNTGGSFFLVYRIKAKNGQIRWFRNHATYMEDEDGHPCYVHGVMLDISDYKDTEEALRRSYKKYQRIFENIQDVYLELDSDGIVLAASPSVTGLTGYLPGELMGKSLSRICVHAPEMNDLLAQLFEKTSVEDVELTVLHQSGRREICSFNARIIAGATGRTTSIVGTLHKITERKMAEIELQKARDLLEKRVEERTAELRQVNENLLAEIKEREQAQNALQDSQAKLLQSQKMEALGQLACGISHDFSNLLTIIMGYSHMAFAKLSDEHEARDDIDQIMHESMRASKLTQKLLSMGRTRILEVKPLDLNELLDEMEPFMRRTLGEQVQLIMVKGDALGSVMADTTSLEQIVLNMAVNAKDAMPEGGTLIVETKVVKTAGCVSGQQFEAEDYVLLSVRDNGCGMDDETQKRIFEPFFTTKLPGEGTGLGLAIVIDLIKQFDGGITIESSPDEGTQFNIFFPRYTADPERIVRKEAQELPRGTECVLIVEDEDTVRHLTTRLLAALGYNVQEAANAGEALLIFEEEASRIDLIISDVVMPKVNGPEMVDRLRCLREDFKVIYITGFSNSVIAHAGIPESGRAPLLRKPYTQTELALKIREILDS